MLVHSLYMYVSNMADKFKQKTICVYSVFVTIKQIVNQISINSVFAEIASNMHRE